MSAAGGACLADTPENVEGLAKPAEASSIGRKTEHPPFLRRNVDLNAKEGVGVPAPVFPHFKPTAISWPEPREQGVLGARWRATPSPKVAAARKSSHWDAWRFAKGSNARSEINIVAELRSAMKIFYQQAWGTSVGETGKRRRGRDIARAVVGMLFSGMASGDGSPDVSSHGPGRVCEKSEEPAARHMSAVRGCREARLLSAVASYEL